MNELPEKLMQYDVISYEYKLTKQSRPDVVCSVEDRGDHQLVLTAKEILSYKDGILTGAVGAYPITKIYRLVSEEEYRLIYRRD